MRHRELVRCWSTRPLEAYSATRRDNVQGRSGDHEVDRADTLLSARFDAGRLPALRRQVAAIVRAHGLKQRVDDFVAAVNELMTNAVRHGGGAGELSLWVQGGLVCEVRDHGRGFPAAHYLHRQRRPALSPSGGMGLWIAQQFSDAISIDSGPTGTTIRIRTAALEPESKVDIDTAD